MALPWFKFYGAEYLSDPKMLGLHPLRKACWVTLLSLASISTDPGQILHLTEEKLLLLTGIDMTSDDWDLLKGTLSTFEKLGMIELDGETVIIRNFQRRQGAYLTEAQKKAKYREKTTPKGTLSTTIREDKIRIDKNKPLQPSVAEEPFNSVSYFRSLKENKQRHIQIIGLYWEFKNYSFPTREAASSSLTRDLRAGKALIGYDDAKILQTMEFLAAKQDLPKWTLETVGKYINEL